MVSVTTSVIIAATVGMGMASGTTVSNCLSGSATVNASCPVSHVHLAPLLLHFVRRATGTAPSERCEPHRTLTWISDEVFDSLLASIRSAAGNERSLQAMREISVRSRDDSRTSYGRGACARQVPATRLSRAKGIGRMI